MGNKRLTQDELADRWGISPRTLERWRCEGKGIKFIKIGRRVAYRMEDIEPYELANLHSSTTTSEPDVEGSGREANE